MCAMAGIRVLGTQLVGVKRTIVTTISAHRRGESTTTFTGVEVNPGESLADTAAQSWIIVLRPFWKVEEALLYKFGLKTRVIQSNSQAVGIGGKAKVLGKVGDAFWSGRCQRCSEIHCGGQSWSPALDSSVSAQTSWCCDRSEQQHNEAQEDRSFDLIESFANWSRGSKVD